MLSFMLLQEGGVAGDGEPLNEKSHLCHSHGGDMRETLATTGPVLLLHHLLPPDDVDDEALSTDNHSTPTASCDVVATLTILVHSRMT